MHTIIVLTFYGAVIFNSRASDTTIKHSNFCDAHWGRVKLANSSTPIVLNGSFWRVKTYGNLALISEDLIQRQMKSVRTDFESGTLKFRNLGLYGTDTMMIGLVETLRWIVTVYHLNLFSVSIPANICITNISDWGFNIGFSSTPCTRMVFELSFLSNLGRKSQIQYFYYYREEQEHEIEWATIPTHWCAWNLQIVRDKESNIYFYPSGEHTKWARKLLLA